MTSDLSPPAARAWAIVEALGAGDVDAALANMSDDATWWINAIRRELPLSVMRGLLERLLAFAPMQYTLLRAIVDGGTVVLEVESHADTKDGGHYNGMYALVCEVRDDKVTSVREHADTKHGFDVIPTEVLMGPSA